MCLRTESRISGVICFVLLPPLTGLKGLFSKIMCSDFALAARVSSLKEVQNEPPDLSTQRDQARISPSGMESKRKFFPHCASILYAAG